MQLPYRHDKYVLLAEIAQGGMAVVYRAKALGPEGFVKDVAIKRLLPAWSGNREFITLLLDEAHALTRLQHQNIVQVLELGMDAGTYFLVMEYVAGLDLHTLLHRLAAADGTGVRLPDRFAYAIIMEVLKGLACAHTQTDAYGAPLGLVHRDISPHNVLVSFQGEVKVADFGIAKGAHRRQETVGAQLKGKYAYMSPEQARGEPVDRRSDLFAVGVLLFELLSARPCFEGPNDLAVLQRVREAALPDAWEQAIHPAVRPILRRALALHPHERYPTAATFLADLGRFVAQHQVTAHSVELAEFLQQRFPDDVARMRHAVAQPLPPEVARALARTPRTRGYTRHGSGRRKGRRGARSVLVGCGLALCVVSAVAVRGDAGMVPVPLVARTIPPPPLPELPAMPWDDVPGPGGEWGAEDRQLQEVCHREPRRGVAIPRAQRDCLVAAAPRNDSTVPDARPLTTHRTSRSRPSAPASLRQAGQARAAPHGVLIVDARPWGYVSVPGVVARSEAPLRLPLPAGHYAVQIESADAQHQVVYGDARVTADRHTICRAQLGTRSRLECE